MADAANELGKRDEAIAAAQKAVEHASTSGRARAVAAQLAYVAQTDLAVEFSRDANGRTQMVTTRIPHNASNWNPFIEPGDDSTSRPGNASEKLNAAIRGCESWWIPPAAY